MNGNRSTLLPLAPLLQVFERARPADASTVPWLGTRFTAIAAARERLLREEVLDTASDAEFADELDRFYTALVRPAFHRDTLRRRVGMVRFGITHLLRCPDPMPIKVDRAIASEGPYHVAGLGPTFWSALAQAIDPRMPSWLPFTERALRRLQRLELSPGPLSYPGLVESVAIIHRHRPDWSGVDLDLFLAAVAGLEGRDLAPAWTRLADETIEARVGPALVRLRAERPLRPRIKEQGDRWESARRQLEAGLHDGHAGKILAALALAGSPVGPVPESDAQTLALWVGRVWESDSPLDWLPRFDANVPLPGAGPGLLPAVLHLRDPAQYPPWNDAARQGFALIDETFDPGDASSRTYRLYVEGTAQLRQAFQIHPTEMPDLLGTLAASPEPASERGFGGFSADSFAFLDELTRTNNRRWFDQHRERYLFAVRQPMVELCDALADRYIRPVLGTVHGWHLETQPHPSRCFSSIARNDYGRSVPYETALWFAFYRTERGNKREDLQLFVRLESTGLSFGVYLGRRAGEVRECFQRNLDRHGAELFAALTKRSVFESCRFTHSADPLAPGQSMTTTEALRQWASASTIGVLRSVPPDSTLARRDELVGEILMTFDRLVPLLAAAYTDDPTPWLRPAGEPAPVRAYLDADFAQETYLSAEWLRRARTLLEMKRQLILQGVPGTGKTHVARGLARLLTRGREDTIRLVQFHPNYSYEEFVEGIKPKTVEINGRNEVSYPVESGLLCRFAAEAAARPAEPHVLVIDEINRGNLPRVFGELLYLLEYRDEAVGLPYSGRGFRLPPNLYLIGTMNAADRSAMLLDQALRRRFSFLEMPPDPGVLAAWLRDHPPRAGDEFAQTVVALFEGLNLRLRHDVGPAHQVGHSYFMVPGLDEDRLHAVWDHHIQPLLADYLTAQPQRLMEYDLDRLLRRRTARIR